MDASASVTDSTDWTSTTLPGFASLDSALRCQVCKDFYDTPMMTSCSHTFCSLCIRRCLSSDGKCPACRTGDQASKLRRNWAVQEVVDAFKSSRQAAFELASKKIPVLEVSSNAVNGQKRKREALSSNTNDRPARETRRTRQQTQREGQTHEIIAVDSEAEGSDADFSPEGDNAPEDGLVACPICKSRMKVEAVYSHLDSCVETPPESLKARTQSVPQLKSASPNNSVPQPPPTRIPQLNYSLLKDNALRKKLQELGIPSTGPRQLLIKRHTEWADLYNANCDSNHPRPRRALLQDLQVWEKSQNTSTNQGAGAFSNGVAGQTQVMAKDFDGDGWREKHKDQFSDLISQARAKAKAPKSGDGTPETNAQSKTPPQLSVDTIAPPIPLTHSTSSFEQSAQRRRRRSSTQLPPDASPISRVFCDAAESISNTPNQSPSRSPMGSSMSSSGVRKVPMFQVPEEPMRDFDGASIS